MVVLYVKGQRIGTLAEVAEQIPAIIARGDALEFRDERGWTLRTYEALPEPPCPWRPELTREEINRISAAGGGIPLTEFWKRMGVQ